MSKYFFSIVTIYIIIIFSSCELVGGIFKAGVGFGIFAVLAVIAFIIFLISRFTKKS